MAKRMTKQEALDRIKDIFNKNRWEFINQIDKDAIKIAYKVLEERVNEEKVRIEYEPDMDMCHFIKSEHCVDTDEYINWYVYYDVPVKEITTYLSWRHEIIYEVNYNGKRYVYLDLEDACKFIENNIILHG